MTHAKHNSNHANCQLHGTKKGLLQKTIEGMNMRPHMKQTEKGSEGIRSKAKN